ncbi:HlyD family efflux transporter periplasmic adaptor subunit [Desulfosporosinus sp. PR]|uniref:efflux RND transporter periplasmic adaptor subunit n=1 Tax=Candidatus Desulfosporosinus nitrosoreducens TaxID=3401928 RepID=UPI0027EDE56E|nr:HlyD family efflux transporter periplasmic adaptor subunit [Desulfosporosinus sp. PR]MDQ7093905.1 HlyD family efflux transporter periplasmic adaptor subunit [Desulfosporosinus sp. PR]
MNKKWVTIGALVVVVAGGGFWGYQHFKTKPAVSSFTTAKAKLGDVQKVITATGTVNYPHAITLTFPTSGNASSAGKIVELNVKAGDTVKAGQVLAKIDDTKLKTSVLQAQANVTSAESKLQNLEDSYNDQTRAQAQAALEQAEQNLTTAKQNADPGYLSNQVTLANQNVKAASDNLAKAQQSGNSSSIQSAQSSLNSALDALTTAQNNQNGGAAQALAAAQANVTSAQYQVDQQAQGPKPADVQSAQASIQIAQAQLASAQADLDDAAIVAPVDAVVVDCPLQLGQDSDSKSIMTLTPTGDKLEVDAAIDQSDITQCKVGQKVDITLDSYPNDHISGTVNAVALQGTTTQNVTTYEVTATVDQNSDLLRAGMNANINIIVAEASNVLTIPSEAVKTRGTETYVMVPGSPGAGTGQANSAAQAKPGSGNSGNAGAGNVGSGSTGSGNAASGNAGSGGYTGNGSGARSSGAGNAAKSAMANVRMVPVVVGLDDGTNVEIKSGLEEGQEVITGTRTASATTNSNSSSGLRLPGMGGGAVRATGGGGGAPTRRN